MIRSPCAALCFPPPSLSCSVPTHTPSLYPLSPHATSAYFLSSLTLLQTNYASTLSSIMRICRRSPSTLWFATSTPRDSRLEHHNCHKGTKHTQKCTHMLVITTNEWEVIYYLTCINYCFYLKMMARGLLMNS